MTMMKGTKRMRRVDLDICCVCESFGTCFQKKVYICPSKFPSDSGQAAHRSSAGCTVREVK